MKRLLFTCLILVFLFGCDNDDVQPTKSDMEFKELIVGTWVNSPKDSYYKKYGQITEYKNNGTLYFTGFSDAECKTQTVKIIGDWSIEDGHIYLRVTKSNTELIAVGEIMSDKILDINEEEMELLSVEDNTKLYRARSPICII